jgi:hypothetical protein
VRYLGKSLAIIGNRENKSSPDLLSDGKSNQKNVVENIEKRLKIINSSKSSMFININIPNESCLIENPFMENNIDFFLLYLGIAICPNNKCIDCNKLIKHLNDCYRCFDLYCNTIREYLLEKERLLRK